MAELANCERCGALYVKTVRDICQDCYKKEEEAFQLVNDFLRERKNRNATILEIAEATDVEEELIIKFVKDRRLTPTEFPNLSYPCERCREQITTGKICESCRRELQKDLRIAEDEERVRRERAEKESIYFTLDKHKK
jgi:flagellar operon protein (TIGR03826 family)